MSKPERVAKGTAAARAVRLLDGPTKVSILTGKSASTINAAARLGYFRDGFVAATVFYALRTRGLAEGITLEALVGWSEEEEPRRAAGGAAG